MPNAKRPLHTHTDEYPSGGSFARLLDWHLVHWNTCPHCSLTRRNPQHRTLRDFAFAVHLRVASVKTDDNAERKLRYWRKGPTLPDQPQVIEDICFHLFGEDQNLAEWRNDLVQAYEREQAAKLKVESQSPSILAPIPLEPSRKSNPDLTFASSPNSLSTARSRSGSIRKQIDRVVAVVLGSAVYDGIKTAVSGSSERTAQQRASAQSTTQTDALVLIREDGHLRLIDRQTGDSDLVQEFITWVTPEVNNVVPEHHTPLFVETTLDLRLQQTAVDTMQPLIPEGAQGALTTIDHGGAIRALIGGIGKRAGRGLGIDELREAGSAWRLFVYADAILRGASALSGFTDEPMTIDGWNVPQTRYGGAIDLLTAFVYSQNSVAMKIALRSGYRQGEGFPGITNTARHFGITTPISTEISMPLGSSKVRILDMARAFAILAAGGLAIEPFGVTKVTTLGRVRQGGVISAVAVGHRQAALAVMCRG